MDTAKQVTEGTDETDDILTEERLYRNAIRISAPLKTKSALWPMGSSVSSGTKLSNAQDSWQIAKMLAEAPSSHDFELARALYLANATTPGSLLEITRITPLKRSKAYALRRIGERLDALPWPDAELASIGWAKLAVVVAKCKPGTEEIGLTLAMHHPAPELRRLLAKEPFAKPTANPSKKRSLNLVFTQPQFRLLRRAVLQNGAKQAKNNKKGLLGVEAALCKIIRKQAEL